MSHVPGYTWVLNRAETVATELHSSYHRTDELIHGQGAKERKHRGVCAAGTHPFCKLLQRVEEERRSFVIEKRGAPRAILLSIRDYVRLAAPEPEVLTILGEESRARGTNVLNAEQIDRIIRAARQKKTYRLEAP